MRWVCLALELYVVAIFARIILSYFPISPGSALAPVFSGLYTITEPVLGPLRKLVPPLRIGMGAIDLSPIIVIFAFRIIAGGLC